MFNDICAHNIHTLYTCCRLLYIYCMPHMTTFCKLNDNKLKQFPIQHTSWYKWQRMDTGFNCSLTCEDHSWGRRKADWCSVGDLVTVSRRRVVSFRGQILSYSLGMKWEWPENEATRGIEKPSYLKTPLKSYEVSWDSWKLQFSSNTMWLHVYTYTSANSCVDRLNTEGGRDSALWLMHGDSHLLFLWVRTMHAKSGCVQS